MGVSAVWPRQTPWLARSSVLGLVMILGTSVGALAQDPDLPPPEDWATQTIPFAVVPFKPTDASLTLLVHHHDCGKRLTQSPRSAIAEVAESSQEVSIRVDVRVDPDGRLCSRGELLRLPVELASPLGSRTVVDSSRGAPALINVVEPPNLGLRYGCGWWTREQFTYAELMGPGPNLEDRGITPNVPDARIIRDEGDSVVLRGPFAPNGKVTLERWRHQGNGWQASRERCRLEAISPDGLSTGTWRLRGPLPAADAKTLETRVDEWTCGDGSSPAGRIVPPQQHRRPDALYLLFRIVSKDRSWEANVRIADRKAGAAQPARFVDCAGRPPASYKVKLWWRLGERALYDAAYFPPKLIKEPT